MNEMYDSTRGGVKGLSFEEALFSGYASDGGLLLPRKFPKLTPGTLEEWAELSFTDLAKRIVGLFVPEAEIPRHDLEDLIDKSFSKFSCPEIAPVKRLKDGLNILELFHGPTWAFKDLALSCVGQFYNYFCCKRKIHYTILVGTAGDTGSAAIDAVRGLPWVDIVVILPLGRTSHVQERQMTTVIEDNVHVYRGTSGDTGGAAIEAVRGLPWVDIVVLLPLGRTSHVQERQMTTVIEDNVHVYRADGTSDDIDLPIKRCFLDGTFVTEHRLTSINSINWARIMVQIVHYFYAYFKMFPSCDGEVEVVIPTGACGNVTGGCIAREMGLPVRMVCAVTRNDIVARAIRDGDFSLSSDVQPTWASAMDIQIPYNMERLWYVFSGGDSGLVAKLMDEFEKTGRVSIPKDLASKIADAIVDTHVVTDDVMMSTMRRIWEENFYHVCPHTATAAAYHFSIIDRENADLSRPRICIATASIAKFQEAALSAGVPVQDTPAVTALDGLPTKYVDLAKDLDWEAVLREKIVDIDNKRRAVVTPAI